MKAKIRDRVESLLIAMPECKDDDLKILLQLWFDDAPEGLKHHFRAVFNELLNNRTNYVKSEGCRRARQKLQQHEPSLRGITYDKRQKLGEQKREEIRTEKAENESPGYNHVARMVR